MVFIICYNQTLEDVFLKLSSEQELEAKRPRGASVVSYYFNAK